MMTTESVEAVEESPFFQVMVKSPIHLGQTVWVVRKYKVQVETGVCPCCGGKGEIFGLDRVLYSCPRTMEQSPTYWKDCLNGTTTQMSMKWSVHEGVVKKVLSEIEKSPEKGLRQTLSYRVSWEGPLLPGGDWGQFKLEELGFQIDHQIYTTKEEAEEARVILLERDSDLADAEEDG